MALHDNSAVHNAPALTGLNKADWMQPKARHSWLRGSVALSSHLPPSRAATVHMTVHTAATRSALPRTCQALDGLFAEEWCPHGRIVGFKPNCDKLVGGERRENTWWERGWGDGGMHGQQWFIHMATVLPTAAERSAAGRR